MIPFKAFNPIPNWRASTLQPPPAFRGAKSSHKKLNVADVNHHVANDHNDDNVGLDIVRDKQLTRSKLERSTELTTLLSRLKPSSSLKSLNEPNSSNKHQNQSQNEPFVTNKQRTQTRLEQTISGSGIQGNLDVTGKQANVNLNESTPATGGASKRPSRIRTHIMFESDSDSLTGSGRSSSTTTAMNQNAHANLSKLNSNSRGKSELVTKTKYFSQQPNSLNGLDEPINSQTRNSKNYSGSSQMLGNDYDYSLCVDRVRNEKVEKRVK